MLLKCLMEMNVITPAVMMYLPIHVIADKIQNSVLNQVNEMLVKYLRNTSQSLTTSLPSRLTSEIYRYSLHVHSLLVGVLDRNIRSKSKCSGSADLNN